MSHWQEILQDHRAEHNHERHSPSYTHGLRFLLEAAYLDPSWVGGCGGWFLVSKMSLWGLGWKEGTWGY